MASSDLLQTFRVCRDVDPIDRAGASGGPQGILHQRAAQHRIDVLPRKRARSLATQEQGADNRSIPFNHRFKFVVLQLREIPWIHPDPEPPPQQRVARLREYLYKAAVRHPHGGLRENLDEIGFRELENMTLLLGPAGRATVNSGLRKPGNRHKDSTPTNTRQLVHRPDRVRDMLERLTTNDVVHRAAGKRKPLDIGSHRTLTVIADPPCPGDEEVDTDAVSRPEEAEKGSVRGTRVQHADGVIERAKPMSEEFCQLKELRCQMLACELVLDDVMAPVLGNRPLTLTREPSPIVRVT